MNEILYRRELKRVMSFGIPKHTAKYIVDGVMEVVKKPENLQKYIDYAIDLQFSGLSRKRKMNRRG